MKTITGIWQDSRGNLAAWGKLHLKLNQDAVVKSTNQVAPREVEFLLTQQGALRFDARVWANDELSPDGTYYTATVTGFGGGLIWGPQWIIISGPDPVNINAILPMLTIPPVDQAASISIVTSPTLVAGVLGASVSGPLGVSTNLVTVSDQLVLAAGSNISLTGSLSQQSLTLSINAPTPPTLGIADVTANGLMLYAGSHVTLSTSIDVTALSATIHAGGGGAGGAFTAWAESQSNSDQVAFYGGSNITLATATDFNGLSIQINGPFTSQLTSLTTGLTSMTTGLTSLGGGYGLAIGATSGGQVNGYTGPWTQSATLRACSGVTVTGSPLGPTATGSIGIFANQYALYAGSNVTLATSTLDYGRNSITINAGGGGGGTTNQTIISNPAFSAGALGQTVTNQVMLTAGSNAVLSTSSNASGMTVTINGRLQLDMGSAPGGSTAGPGGTQVVSVLHLYAGSNMTMSMSNYNYQESITFIAGGGGGIGSVSLVASNAAGVTSGTNASGSTFTVSAPFTSQLTSYNNWTASSSAWNQATSAGGGFLAGITASATNATGTTGSLGPVSSALYLAVERVAITGPQWSGSVNGNSMTATLRFPFGLAGLNVLTAPGGTTAGAGFSPTLNSALWLAAGSNMLISGNGVGGGITATLNAIIPPEISSLTSLPAGLSSLSSISNATQVYFQAGLGVSLGTQASSNSETIIINATGGGGGTGGGSFMAGALGQLVTNQLMLTTGANMSLQTSTNASGMTVSFSAIPQTSLTASYSSVVTSLITSMTSGVTSLTTNVTTMTTGLTTLTSQFTSLTNTTALTSLGRGWSYATGNPNITVSMGTNSAGTTATFWGPAAGGGGTTYSAPTVTLAAGANISLQTTTNANGTVYTISGIPQTSLTSALTSYNNWTASSNNWNTAGNWTASSAAWNAATGTGANRSVSLVAGLAASIASTTNATGSTFTVSAPFTTNLTSLTTALTSYNNWTGSSANWNTAGNWSASSSQWNAATSGGGAGGASRYFAAIKPIIPTYTTWSQFGVWGYSCSLWPLDRPAPGNYSQAYFLSQFNFNITSTQTNAIAISMSLGFYTRTGNSLSRMSSGSTQYVYSVTANANLTNFNYLKQLKIPITPVFDDNRDYWAGYCISTSSAGNQSLTHAGVAYEYGMSGVAAGEFGQNTNSTWQRVPFWGVFTGANSLPATVAIGDIRASSATLGRVPMMWLGGWTA